MKMEALRYFPGEPSGLLKLDSNVPQPQIVRDDDVLVEVAFAGLCGTDIHIMQVRLENLIVVTSLPKINASSCCRESFPSLQKNL